MGLQRCREVKGGGGHATGRLRWVGRKEAGQHMQGMGTERREQGTGQEAEVEPWVGASELTSQPGLGRHRWALMTDKPRRAWRMPEPLVMVTSALQRARAGGGRGTEPMERSQALGGVLTWLCSGSWQSIEGSSSFPHSLPLLFFLFYFF